MQAIHQQLPPAVCIMGPTASGKTGLAVDLVSRFPFEIISVDSALVYRGMDIGTAKPDAKTLVQAPHKLIDLIEPEQVYSAARFCNDALQEMAKITARGNVPLLVGGTMLYYTALQQGLSPLPSASPEVRDVLQAQLERIGLAAMHQRLSEIDPVAAQRIHENDPQRILRALEVFKISGRTHTELCKGDAGQSIAYTMLKFVISPSERLVLHQRIARRFGMMLEQGFEDEVRGLMRRPELTSESPSMRAVGYRQMWAFIEGAFSNEELEQKAVAATRQLAKRQLTWLRREQDAHWLDAAEPGVMDRIVAELRVRHIFQ